MGGNVIDSYINFNHREIHIKFYTNYYFNHKVINKDNKDFQNKVSIC